MGISGVGILLPQILEQGSLDLELIFQGSGLVGLTQNRRAGSPTLGGIMSPSWVIFFPPKLGKGRGALEPRGCSEQADRNLFPAV